MASHQQQAAHGSDSSSQVQMKKDEYMNKVNDAASDVSGQAQMKREEYGNKTSEAANQATNKAETKREEYTNRGHEAADKAGEKKDELANKASDASQSANDNSTVQAAQTYAIELKDQASTLLQQTGEQVKNIAAGAAEAVKSTLGINNATSNSNATSGNAAAASGGAGAPINPHNPNQLASSGGNSDRK